MKPIDTLRPWFASRMARWLERRLPAQREVSLHRKNIFILPTAAGILFVAATALIFVTAINYVLSLAFALAFLMVSLFLLCILYTFRNLQHLSLQGLGADPVFAGEDAAFLLSVQGQGAQQHEMLELRFPGQSFSRLAVLSQQAQKLTVYLPTQHRGLLVAPRLQVQTRFPLGLWRAWSYVDLALDCLVYPRPLACPLPAALRGKLSGRAESLQVGVEDFHGLRAYQRGDSLKQIAWKNLARGQGLQVKQFVETSDERLLLDWDMFAGAGHEERLSKLCYWVLQLSQRHIDFGLRIPGLEIALGQGGAHRQRALRALALWQQRGE